MTAKHFIFTNEDGRRGRFALAVTEKGKVRFKQLSGPAPTPGHLLSALARWPELIESANEAARNHKIPRVIIPGTGMSGCIDYLVVESRDEEMYDYPVVGVVHVSMYGRLNRPFIVRLADLGLLVERLAENYRPEPVVEAQFWYLAPWAPWKPGFVELVIQLDETGESKVLTRRQAWDEEESE